MIYLVDGSNVLGRARADRFDDEAKRRLTRGLASFLRRERAQGICFFDGPRGDGFATGLGALQVVFSEGRAADDLIVERARESAQRQPVRVVTSDGGLAARVAGRRVEIVAPRALLSSLENAPETAVGETDWASWFSDPKNRTVF